MSQEHNPSDIEKIDKKPTADKRAGNGGARPGAGRPVKPRGPGKVTQDLKKAAQEYTTTALETLVAIATDEEAPAAARVAASNGILDRAHGKPTQTVEGTFDGVVEVRFRR